LRHACRHPPENAKKFHLAAKQSVPLLFVPTNHLILLTYRFD
jgi:hypothetical protein